MGMPKIIEIAHRFGSIRFGSLRIGSVRVSSDRFGLVCLASVRLSAIDLPRIQLCEADSAAILLRILPYEAESDATLHNIPVHGVCFADTLL